MDLSSSEKRGKVGVRQRATYVPGNKSLHRSKLFKVRMGVVVANMGENWIF